MKNEPINTSQKKAIIEQYRDVLDLIGLLDGFIEKNSLKRLLGAEKSNRGVDYILNKLESYGVLNAYSLPLNKAEQKTINRKQLTVYTFTRLTNKEMKGIDATRKKPTKQALIKQDLKVRLITLKHQQAMKKRSSNSLKMLAFLKWYMGTATLLGGERFSEVLICQLEKVNHPHLLHEERENRALKHEQMKISQRMGYLNRYKPIDWELSLENTTARGLEIDELIKRNNLKMLRRKLYWDYETKWFKIQQEMSFCSLTKLSEMNAFITGTGFLQGKLSFEVALFLLSDRTPTPVEMVNKIANVHFLIETLFAPILNVGKSPEINVFYTLYTTQTLKEQKKIMVMQMLREPILGLHTLTALERVHFKSVQAFTQ